MLKGRATRKVLPVLIILLFAFSAIPLVKIAHSATGPAQPLLNQITFVDYAGSDASGVADLQANKIDAYDFALTPSASTGLSSSYNQYVAPAAIYGLYVNPQNTTGGACHCYNPFYYQKVRFALNYLIDRNYFGQTIEGGNFIQCVAAPCAEADSAVVAAGIAPFSNVTYNFAFANQTVYNTLTQNGVTYSGHQYSWEGKPITVNLFDRTDDPIRHAFMQYLTTQIQKLGFQTNTISGTLSTAFNVVFGNDPANATWDIYPASNSQVWGYYDSNAQNFYSAGYYNDLFASDHYGQTIVGTWDNSTQEAASVSLFDKADTYVIPLLTSNFSTMAQRNALLSNLTYYGVLGAGYITIGTSLAPYATTGAVSGVTTNFLTDPFANYMNYMTMSTTSSDASGTANQFKMGVRHITNGAVNPVGGDDDAYSDNVLNAVQLPIYAYGPSTGYPYSTGMTFKVNANTPTGVAVPSSAIWFNGSSDQWSNVPAGSTAQNDVTVNMAKYISHTNWADGQPVTLADMLWQYIEMQRVLATGSPIYDNGAEHGIYSTESRQVVGLQVLNATSVELYTTGTFFPDATWAAYGVILDVISPIGFAGNVDGAGMNPWEMYYAMNQVVANGQAAWSTATATTNKVDWLSLLSPADVANIKTALSAAGSTIPPEISQLQSMTGQSWVTAATASAGYKAAVNFISTNGNAVISDGPFYISQYSPSSSPAFLVMKQNPLFDAGTAGDPHLWASPVVLTPLATIPPVLSAGSSFNITALEAPDGQPTKTVPATNATVFVQLVNNGKVVFSGSYLTGSNGQTQVTLPSSLPASSYLLSVLASSSTSKLIKPLVTPLTLSTATASSSSASMTSGASTMTSSSSTTTSSNNTTLYLGVAVVILVVVVAAGFLLSRRRRT
jgi:peptide/nickel transport system substrate-binding protein